jgi:hypothetical protein
LTRIRYLIEVAVWYVISLIFLAGAYSSIYLLHFFPGLYRYWILTVLAVPVSIASARVWGMFERAGRRWGSLAPAFWIEGRLAVPLVGAFVALGLRLLLNSTSFAPYFGWLVFFLGGTTSVLLIDQFLGWFNLPVLDVHTRI